MDNRMGTSQSAQRTPVRVDGGLHNRFVHVVPLHDVHVRIQQLPPLVLRLFFHKVADGSLAPGFLGNLGKVVVRLEGFVVIAQHARYLQ